MHAVEMLGCAMVDAGEMMGWLLTPALARGGLLISQPGGGVGTAGVQADSTAARMWGGLPDTLRAVSTPSASVVRALQRHASAV